MPRTVDEIIKELEQLTLRQSIVLKELTRANDAKKAPKGQDDEWEFQIGGRVRILNPKKGFYRGGKSTRPRDEFGIVVKVTKSRVHVKLDSGLTVQRPPNNIAVVLTAE